MKKVLLLFGGRSSEHEVSCMSAKSILEHIDRKKFDVTSVGITEKDEWFLYLDDSCYLGSREWRNHHVEKIDNIVPFLKGFDIVFPIIHGTNGEDGKLQGFLDLFGIRYVGSKTLGSALGMDKAFSKMIFEHLHIPQVPYYVISKDNYHLKEIEEALPYPMIIKPANGGSSIGIGKAENKKQLFQAIKEASKYDSKIVIEKFIVARELECAVLEKGELVVSRIGEIIPRNEFYDYNAKYENASQTIIPASLPDIITHKIQDYAKKVFTSLDLHGLARVDFFYDEEEQQIYLNEVNTLPGFTTISMYPKLLVSSKFSYQDLITSLILHV